MEEARIETALVAADVPPRAKATNYPARFAARVTGRQKRALGERFGLRNFGVNLTRLLPGAASALRHAHSKQDELIYVLQGRPALYTNAGRTELAPGMVAGFRAGTGDAHHLVNETDEVVEYLEIGDRTPGDACAYPDDDLAVVSVAPGVYEWSHKDGSAY